MVFYLKLNRQQNYTFRNLQYWIDIIDCYADSQVYIVCDNMELKRGIKEKFLLARWKSFLLKVANCSIKCPQILSDGYIPYFV